MESVNKMVNTAQNNSTDCSPLANVYHNLKIRVTNDLNNNDINTLYECNLCNNCYLAAFNLNTREKAVKNSISIPKVAEIRNNIQEFGNSYGVAGDDVEFNKRLEHEEEMETLLFKGCTSTHKTPEILEAAESLLKHNGIKYTVLDDETCCGNILFNLGDINAGSKVVKRNIKKFKESGVKKIITICPGCYNSFNKHYNGNEGFKPEIFLVIDLLKGSKYCGEDFIVQDPCHAKKKASKVRTILPDAINKNTGSCCGAGAGLMAHNRPLANARAEKVVENNYPRIVTYCPFCYLNLSSVNPDRILDIHILLEHQLRSNK